MFYSPLILPGTQLYDDTLADSWMFLHAQNPSGYYIEDPLTGMQRPATIDEVQEYVYSGEYEEVAREAGYELD